MTKKGVKKICSRGHVFYKSSLCPVCPICWPGQERKLLSDFPRIGAPALRALHEAKILNLKQLSKLTKEEVGALHGIGPKALGILHRALKKNGLSFES